MKCAKCGRRMGTDTVNMLDQCLGCGVTPFPTTPEYVDEIDCSYCDTPIQPENEDGDTAFECSCGSWHHYDCASSCSEYVEDLRQQAAADQAKDERCGA